MIDWKMILADVDDDYLIGLSNKGIVKRAYKDKEEGVAQVGTIGESVEIVAGGETVTVVFPLGDSKCTCPSRSICRHVMQAILVLKDKVAAGDADDANDLSATDASSEASGVGGVSVTSASGESSSAGGAGSAGASSEASSTDNVSVSHKASKVDNEKVGGTDITSDVVNKLNSASAKVQKEIIEYPLPPLKKVLGVRGFNKFISQVKSNIKPEITYSSIVTVKLLDSENVVKLLSPLEYSTCTCHKKELCAHKATAILWCQMGAGILSDEKLFGESMELPDFDMSQIREVAVQMKNLLEELLATGLSRTSQEVQDSMERLAIISHNAGLARFEGYFRALSDSYGRYFMRKASLRTRELMEQISRLYMRVWMLLQAEDSMKVTKLAGEFRADYVPVGNLDLIGIAMEHFSSKTGYEGETIYFLEENTKKWYTYTSARPVFYETGKQRWRQEKSQAPWGLTFAMEELVNVRLHLTGARCDERRRLSSTKETVAEVTGGRELWIEDIKEWYYRDFGQLFTEQIKKQQKSWLVEQEDQEGAELVFVQPRTLLKSEFSKTDQQLTLPLVDNMGHDIVVEVTYSKDEARTIRYLERISERKPSCFLGKVYLRDGKIRMYPVALFDDLASAVMDGDVPDGGVPTAGMWTRSASDGDISAAGVRTGDVSDGGKEKVLQALIEEVTMLMEDLYQSGFDTVHDSTLEDLEKSVKLIRQYGMEYLSTLMSGLYENVSTRRHQTNEKDKKDNETAQLFANINACLYMCRQKSTYDAGEVYYSWHERR